MAWHTILMQHFLVVNHGISLLSLVFSRYTHKPLGDCVYRENTSDKWDISWLTTKNRTRAAANCCHGKRGKRRHFVSFVMNISGAEFEEHCFNISRDILYLVFYHFSCKTYDVITFLVDILVKRHFSPF